MFVLHLLSFELIILNYILLYDNFKWDHICIEIYLFIIYTMRQQSARDVSES